MNTFSIHPQIHFGPDALDRLKALKSRRAFVVADPFVVKSGAIAMVTDRLAAASVPYDVFSDVIPDPPIETVAAGVRALLANEADVIVAIGGGSALDTAKLIREFAGQMAPSIARPRFIAIPTTSGTGSEVTSVAVVTDKANQVKLPLTSDSLLPDEAILDVELVKTVPPVLTADTGMDVFTHAVEACVSTHASDFSDALASKAIEIVGAYLLRSYSDASDLRARTKMHSASCLAGLAFNAASLGLNHGMAHALGGKFHIPHGRANAIVLPHVIEFNADLVPSSAGRCEGSRAAHRYLGVARILGLQTVCPSMAIRALVNWTRFMMSEMKMPTSISQTNVCSEAEYRDAIPAMAEAALKDRCTEGNPRNATLEDVTQLYLKMW